MDLRKHLRYSENQSFPRSHFVGHTPLPVLKRYQCHECRCLGPHDHHHGAAGEHCHHHGKCQAFSEEAAFNEATRRASAVNFDRDAAVPAAWNCGLLAPEWTPSAKEEQKFPYWVENVSDYGTLSDREPRVFIYPQGKSLLQLPPPSRCTRCDPEVMPAAYDNTTRPSEHTAATNWYQYKPMVEVAKARRNEKLRRLPINSKLTSSLSPNQKLPSSINAKYKNRSDHQSNTGSPAPRTGMKTQSAEDTESDGEATVRRALSRPRRPHSATSRTQPPTNRGSGRAIPAVKRSASATTVLSDGGKSRGRSATTRPHTSGRLEKKASHPAERPSDRLRPGSAAGRSGGMAEMQGGGTSEDTEAAGWPSTPCGERKFFTDENADAIGKGSSEEKEPRSPERRSSRPPTRGPSPRRSSHLHQEPAELVNPTNKSVATAEKAEDPEAHPMPGQEKEQKYDDALEKEKLLPRPTIQDGSDSTSEESITPFISRAISQYAVPAKCLGPNSKDESRNEAPVGTDEIKAGSGARDQAQQSATVTTTPEDVNSTAANAKAAPTEEAVVNLDFHKCVKVILNSETETTRYNTNQEKTYEGHGHDDFQGINQLTAEVTEQLVRAPDARKQAIHSAETTRDLTAADSTLSTTLSCDAAASAGNSSSSRHSKRSAHKRNRSISKGRHRSTSSIHSQHEIASVVNEQLKQIRIGVGQLEKLIKFQRLLEEEISELKTQNQPE